MKSKFLALILAAVCAFGCLAGCGDNTGSAVSESVISSEPVSQSDVAEEVDMFRLAYEKYDADEVVMTINGIDVHWDEFYTWLYSACKQIQTYYGSELDWSQTFYDEVSYEADAIAYAESMVSQYVVISEKFNELELTLNDEEQADLDNALQESADENAEGDLEKFKLLLKDIYISEDYYLHVCATTLYYTALFRNFFGEDGASLPDEDALAYAADNGYMFAKHILFKTVDDSGTALSEDVIAAKKSGAEEVLSRLNACETTEEMLALFDTLEAEFNEDQGRLNYPDGYFFAEGEMVEEFENAVKALEENQISGLVESPYGYHIILRPAMNPDAIMLIDSYGSPRTLRYIAAATMFDSMAFEWLDDAEIVYTEKFENLALNELFSAE